jgi:hypothetical protein
VNNIDRINKLGKWAKIVLQQNISTLPFGLEIQCPLFDSSREVVADRSPPLFFPNLMIVNRQHDTLRPISMPTAALAENRRGTDRVRLPNDESTSISIKSPRRVRETIISGKVAFSGGTEKECLIG